VSVFCTVMCVMERGTVRMDLMSGAVNISVKQVKHIKLIRNCFM